MFAAGLHEADRLQPTSQYLRRNTRPKATGNERSPALGRTIGVAWGAARRLANAPRRGRKQGRLSEKSIHDHFALLKQILSEAVRERLILDNPAAVVRAPGKGWSRRRTYTMAQVIALVRYLGSTPVLMKALTGLQRGELLALRWRYIDLGTGEVHVVEPLERRRDGSLHFKVPKTEDSAPRHPAGQCPRRAVPSSHSTNRTSDCAGTFRKTGSRFLLISLQSLGFPE